MTWKPILLVAALAATPSYAQIYTGNSSGNRITVHAVDADGDEAPVREISGPSTGLDLPFAVALDVGARELFVSNLTTHTVAVFDLDADGDVAPLRQIAGVQTQLSSPIGLDLDRVNDEVVVRNFGGSEILAFALDADGDVAPLRQIAGAATGIVPDTTDLFVDPVHDEIVVANRDDPGAVLVFSRTATGNVAPIRAIQGPATGLVEPYGVFVDLANDEIYTAGHLEVLVFARTASGNAAPLRRFADPGFTGPTGIGVDVRRDEVLVSYQGINALAAYPRTADGMVASLRTIQGPATQLLSPTLLAADPSIVFVDGFESGDATAWSATIP